VGEVASDLFALLVPEAPLGALDALWARLPEVVGPRGRVSLAQGPRDGLDAETLLGRAWHRLLGEDRLAAEPVLADPVMVRLAALGERLAEMEGAVCAVGPAGSGRATLLRALAAAAGRRVFECSALDAEALAGAAARSPDWTLVRDSDQAPEAVAALLRRARGRVLATAASRPAAGAFPHVFEVPPLHARVEDVLPLAEAFVAASRQAAGRPRLTLGAEARALLKAWRWPGNVRELENALWRAARVSVRDEIGPDALPAALGAEARPEDLRGALKSAERELLLEALARTRWNVTAAAARLGLPRRTVVYRMAKLGLRRPAR
jgi:DNA-binding NtrC family response regulator